MNYPVTKPGDVARAIDRASGDDGRGGRMAMRSVLWVDPSPELACAAAVADYLLDVAWAPSFSPELRYMADRGAFDFVLLAEGVAPPAGDVSFRVLRVGGEVSP